MNAIRRAAAILIDPAAAWLRIEKEPADPVYLLTRYVTLLALVPALFGFVGACIVGVVVPGIGPVRASLFDGIFGAIFGYLESFVVMLVLASIVRLAAPLFGGRGDFAGALTLSVYSYTPVWLTGIFLLLPGLRFLELSGFYSIYLLVLGLPPIMKTPQRRSIGFAVVIAACAFGLTLIAAFAQRKLFGGPTGP